MRRKWGHSEIIVILDIYDEEDVPYQQYADSRTQFDEQAEAVAASALSCRAEYRESGVAAYPAWRRPDSVAAS